MNYSPITISKDSAAVENREKGMTSINALSLGSLCTN